MPAGRNRTLDEAKQREVCALLSTGCSLEAAASYVECAPNTIRREAQRNPNFGRRLREARLQAQLSPLQAMRKAANNHWRAAAWMLERADPEHFDRRPSPAFRPKQAQTLRQDILAILNTEIEDPSLLQRVRGQIQHLMQYSIDGVVRVERTDRQLRAVMREIDELERNAEQRERSAHARAVRGPLTESPKSATAATIPVPRRAPESDAESASSVAGPAPPKTGAPNSVPTNAPQLDPALAALPVTWGDMTQVFQRLQAAARNADRPSATTPTLTSASVTAADANSTSQPAFPQPTDEKEARNSNPAPSIPNPLP